VRTKYAYLQGIYIYFRWLRESKGVTLSPDEPIVDNLRALYDSKATDASAKRKHTNAVGRVRERAHALEGVKDRRHQWVSGSARSSCHEKGRLANASQLVWRARWSVIDIADMEESAVLFPTKRKLCFNQLRKES